MIMLTQLVSCLLTLLLSCTWHSCFEWQSSLTGGLEVAPCRALKPAVNHNSFIMSEIRVSHNSAQDQLDGLGEITEGVQLPKDFIGADGSFEAPSVEKILEALEGMSGLSIEDKESLKNQLLQQQMRGSFGDDEEHPWGEIPAGSFFANQIFILFFLLCVIALIFVFFGLKLYRSLVEKERKREEKRKLKMMKKKK